MAQAGSKRRDDYEAALAAVSEDRETASPDHPHVFARAGLASGREFEALWPPDYEYRDRPCDIRVGDITVHIPAVNQLHGGSRY